MKKILLYILVFIIGKTFAQQSETITLNWNSQVDYNLGELTVKIPQFQSENFEYNVDSKSIIYKKVVDISNLLDKNALQISNVSYKSITENDLYDLDKSKITPTINAKFESVNARGVFKGFISINPIIKDASGYKKVVSFTYTISNNSISNRNNNRNAFSVSAVSNSVLATGNWYKFYIEKSGVYRISKSFLQSLGLNVNVDPRTIKLYGNGGRMLPLLNDTPYPMDLEENAIQFIGEEDGVFDASDYILFYAEGVDTWNEESLTHVNQFSDKSYYYVTTSGGFGKRIKLYNEPAAASSLLMSNYDG